MKLKILFLKAIGVIPGGYYCHFSDMKKVCRYWSSKDDLPYRENGYCSFLRKSDWDINEECETVEVTHFAQHRETHKTIESTHELEVSLL